MAQAMMTKSKSGGRTKAVATQRSAVAKYSTLASASNASVKLAAGSLTASKDELRARIEKLERANATLRSKNKDLRVAHVDASEQVDALTLKLEILERRIERQSRPEMPKAAKPRAAAPRGRGAAKVASRFEGETEQAEA